ncbi:hypothetical protein N7481_006668 [Penicillium waksmanii]|uniref:uncharacterized protein n=1 Tax=Penicillium waksmanii TaxID=69791 RepID=UPI0025476D1C|nr:uncharacterized protein N7481_006668 [Penicillium waksmanii]KAJ5984569.1 hypothetical protein N7481_006668 [Penicillium waksmanii]
MKTSSITTTFLALTGATIAAPSNVGRDLKAFQLTKLTASLYDQSLPAYRIVNFDLNDPNNNVDTSCSSAWSGGMSGAYKFNCSNPNYQVNFPSLYDIEDIKLNVSVVNSKAFAPGEINGDKWKCENTGAEYPSKVCNWDGVYDLPIVLA